MQGNLYSREVAVCARSTPYFGLSSCWGRLAGKSSKDTTTSSYPRSRASQPSAISTRSCPHAYTTYFYILIFPLSPYYSRWSQYIYTACGVRPHLCTGFSCDHSLCPQFRSYITSLCYCLYYHGTADDSY